MYNTNKNKLKIKNFIIAYFQSMFYNDITSKGAIEMRVKKNLDKIIYDQMIDSFILGEYKMDDVISLDVLCGKYEVSRTPVVQAVKLLVNDGVLEKLSNGRVVVPTFDQGQIKNICDVRLMIEKHAIEHFLTGTEDISSLIEQLEICARKCEEYLNQSDFLELSKTDLRFHRVLVSGAKNGYLSELYKRIQGQFLVANYLVLPLRNRNFSSTVDDHYRLLECLRDKDMEQADQLIAGHINNIFYVITNQK